MNTPRENRFAKLALEQGVLTSAQLETIVDYQQRKRAEGAPVALWDSAVLNNMMEVGVAERLRERAGDLDLEKLDQYMLLQQLGRGGMGSVWLARDTAGEQVAVKILDSSLAAERAFLTRFLREAEMSARLKHDGIVRGVGVGEAAGHYYFAMEFVDGQSLADIIDAEGPLPPRRAAEIVLAAAKALAYAHQNGVIHRDIKPANILVTRDGRAKVADLGVARLQGQELTRLTATGMSMGTPFYMSPEQCQDAKHADARCDIYSLGATWYHMIVGEAPFTGDSHLDVMRKHVQEPLRWPAETHKSLPPTHMLVIERMMNKSPDGRIQTMREVVQTIQDKCLGERDIFEELGVEKDRLAGPKRAWVVRLRKGRDEREFRVSDPKLRELIRSGKVSPATKALRIGEPGPYQPIGRIRELAAELPTVVRAGPAAPAAPAWPATRARKGPSATKRASLHEFVAHFDKHDRSYRRRQKVRKLVRGLVSLLITIAIMGGIAYVGYRFLWPVAKDRLGQSAPGAQAEGSAP